MIRDLRSSRRSISPKGAPRLGLSALPSLSDYVPLEAAARSLVERFLAPRDALGHPVLPVNAGLCARVIQRVESREITLSIFDSLLLDAELSMLPLFSAFVDHLPHASSKLVDLGRQTTAKQSRSPKNHSDGF